MFVRSLLGAAALAAGAGFASAQPATSPFPARLSAPVAVAQPPAPQPHQQSRLRLASLLQPVADPQPAAPAPVAVNPAAPPGFNAPLPVYQYDDNDRLGAPGRFYARGEWLYWATSGQSVPALATAAPSDTARNLAGILGSPTTTVIGGDGTTNKDVRNGFRGTAGWWLDDCQKCGIEADFFFLGNSKTGFSAASDGSAIITRPFFNAVTGLPDTQLVSFPGTVGGSVIGSSQNSVIGGGISMLKNICGTGCGRLDWVFGYRYLNVSDDLSVTESLTALGGQNQVTPGTTFVITDRFKTSNNFHGSVIGLSGDRSFGRWFVGARASVALGMNYSTVDIEGSTTITPPGGAPTTYAGGLLAQPTNIGSYSQSSFAVVPEIGLRAGLEVTDSLRIYAGYNFLYMSNVYRAGEQIDLRVNPNLLPPANGLGGPGVPEDLGKSTGFWAQGVSVGLELRY